MTIKKTTFYFSSLIISSIFSTSLFAVNINKADAEELASELNGVGPVLAQKIIDYREENGEFSTADQLTQIKGIGNSVVSENQENIEVE